MLLWSSVESCCGRDIKSDHGVITFEGTGASWQATGAAPVQMPRLALTGYKWRLNVCSALTCKFLLSRRGGRVGRVHRDERRSSARVVLQLSLQSLGASHLTLLLPLLSPHLQVTTVTQLSYVTWYNYTINSTRILSSGVTVTKEHLKKAILNRSFQDSNRDADRGQRNFNMPKSALVLSYFPP